MLPDPRVSVVMPVFNAERYVEAAARSVLAQTLGASESIELIVVDDGSSDRSREVLAAVGDPRCRVLRQSKSGAAAARNLGVASARGQYLGFLDADDVWGPTTLERQCTVLSADPSLDMVFGHFITVDAQGRPLKGSETRPGYSLCTMLIRRERFLRVGLFSTEWRVGEFIDWYARAEEAGLRHAMLPDVLLHRRAHDANTTGHSQQARVDYARIVAAAAARRALLGTPRG